MGEKPDSVRSPAFLFSFLITAVSFWQPSDKPPILVVTLVLTGQRGFMGIHCVMNRYNNLLRCASAIGSINKLIRETRGLMKLQNG